MMPPIPRKQLLLRGCLVVLPMLLAFIAGRQSVLSTIVQSKISNNISKLKLVDTLLSILQKPELARRFDLTDGRRQMQRKVTVLVFSKDESPHCLSVRIDSILTQYPGIKTIVTSSAAYDNPKPDGANVQYFEGIQREGEALRKMTSMVKTEYFLYMAPGVHLPIQNSDNSVTWLLHALLNVTELDFVGGSYLRDVPGVKYPVLEVPCHRLRLCNWTMSQSFEHRYSIGDMMVCEETSPSFMGRTSSLSKVGPFDSNLITMATTDFFLRGKDEILTGLRPEVHFIVSETCFPTPMSAAQEANVKLPFMSKHELYVLRDSFGREIKARDFTPSLQQSSHYGSQWWEKGTYASPLFIRGIQFSLELADNFFESQNITYFIRRGLALGGLKMRGILPWDRDIDLRFFGDAVRLKPILEKYIADRGFHVNVTLLQDYPPIHNLLVVDDLSSVFAEWYEAEENSFSLMYIDIHGRRYPVETVMFAAMRRHYGQTYLEMHANGGGRQICSLPDGHHACLPEEFSFGGGHWRDFYCEL